MVQLKTALPDGDSKKLSDRDELYESAIDIVVREGRGSVSLLQRSLGIGYGRAARLIDFMAEDGIVGPYNGSQAREILLTVEQWEQRNGQQPTESAEVFKPRRSRKILIAEPDERDKEPGTVRTVKATSDEDEDIDDEEAYEVDSGEDDEPPFDADEDADEGDLDEEECEEEEEDSSTDEADDADYDLAPEPDPNERPTRIRSQRRPWKAESA